MTATQLNTLFNPDGSATHTSAGYTVTASINGPIEVSRRDEQAEEATLEINIRPANGVSSPRERRLELLLHSTLRRIIITSAFPRSLIQLTLQILKSPSPQTNPLPNFTHSSLLSLPALLTTSLLALLSARIPLSTTFTPAITVSASGHPPKLLPVHAPEVVVEKNVAGMVHGLHVFAITAAGGVLLAESEGDFGVEEWEESLKLVQEAVGREEGGRAREWLIGVVNAD